MILNSNIYISNKGEALPDKPSSVDSPISFNLMRNYLKQLTGKITFSMEKYPGSKGIPLNNDASVFAIINGNNAIIYSKSGGGISIGLNGYRMFSYYLVDYDKNPDGLQAEILDVSGLDTSKTISMNEMFFRTKAKKIIGLNKWDTSKVIDMARMFMECHQIDIVDLKGFNTSQVTDMAQMFHNSYVYIIDVSTFDTSKVTDMSDMFHAPSTSYMKKIIGIENFNTINVTNMRGMFWSCGANNLDLNNFNTSKVTNMSLMFCGVQGIIQGIEKFDTSQVTNFSRMFNDGNYYDHLNFINFDTSKATNMSMMFCNALNISLKFDLSSFDTSNVTNMSYMFEGADIYGIKGLKFNTTKVTDMSYMFSKCYKLREALDLSTFSFSHSPKIEGMFMYDRPELEVKCKSTSDINYIKMESAKGTSWNDLYGNEELNTCSVTLIT